jgi:alkanesulfonate monooxygenase SsuD/methylene tetrahydromethanopterin reductase-like flavin-dependent oxidoreductase (luciferase family)
MPDAGIDGPPAHRRHYGQADYRRVYADLIAYAQHCDTLGYDSMWTAEHHFQSGCSSSAVMPQILVFQLSVRFCCAINIAV